MGNILSLMLGFSLACLAITSDAPWAICAIFSSVMLLVVYFREGE